MRTRATLLGVALLIASGVAPGCSFARLTLAMFGDSVSLSSRPKATSQPTTTKAADTEEEKVVPGTYKFKARVKDTWMCPIGMGKCLYGVTTLNGKRCVLTGIDTRWAIDLDVQEVDKPLWFVRAGEPVTIVVHSPTVFFRKDGREAIGEVFDFELTVSWTDNSVLAYHVSIPTSTIPR